MSLVRAGIPPGGTTGEALTKRTDASFDIDWEAGGGSLPVTTFGDLLGFTTEPARVAVGPQGFHLFSDAAETAGLGWGRPLSVYDVVKEGGAKGDSATDDTAAIQGGIDNGDGYVYIPPSPANPFGDKYMFSNLLLASGTRLFGAGMNRTALGVINGSTGIAVREKTSGEGNAGGAIGLVLEEMTISGLTVATANGVDIGNQGGPDLQSGGAIRNLYVAGFPAGIAININANAEFCHHLWGENSKIGIQLGGTGASGNLYAFLFAENNSKQQLIVADSYSSIFGVQIEAPSSADGTVPFLAVTAGGNKIFGVYLSYTGSTVIPKLVEISSQPFQGYGFTFSGGGSFTNGVYHDGSSYGTGADVDVAEFLVGTSNQGSRHRVNATSGSATSLKNDLTTVVALAVKRLAATYGLMVTIDASQASVARIPVTNATAFTIAAPSNPTTFQTLIIEVDNTSGGAMGAITWASVFELAGDWVNPANGKRKFLNLYYDGTHWVQTAPIAADVSN